MLNMAHRERGKKLKMKNVVVVDDDAIIRKTMRLILHKKVNVYTAKDFLEALRIFQEQAIDLAIVDFKLREGTGLDVISAYRKAGFKGEAVLISAFSELVNAESMRNLSIAEVFSKPLDLDEFTETVENLLSGGNDKITRM